MDCNEVVGMEYENCVKFYTNMNRVDVGYDENYYRAEVHFGMGRYKYDFRRSTATCLGGFAVAAMSLALY